LSVVPPIAEQLSLPSSYGSPNRLLDWASVEQRLVDSLHYWVATVRRDGRPHVVPVDGIWLDAGCYFGGDPATVHIRNLRRDGRTALHLEDGESAVIVEGVTEWMTPSKSDAKRLVAAAKVKYGYSDSAASYLAGVWRLEPTTVLAWTQLYVDATRFRFAAGG
jgi:Pyridoxamine 5'-phosphate oxidase